jgi:hypothetical protein
MATHFLKFHLSFGGKGNINTATDVKVVKVVPIVFDQEVRLYICMILVIYMT